LALTLMKLRRTLAPTMPAGFDGAFRRVKEPVADFRANEKFYLSPQYQKQEEKIVFELRQW
jgi:hypothetical protein